MDNFDIVIFIMAIIITLSAYADRIKLPYPILLVVTGLIIGFVPVLPDLALDPNIVFLIFLPPLLFDAAFKMSWHDFKKEIRPISTLAITLVFFTTITVGITAHYLIPGFSWALGFVLGAIVSPPDAVAAAGITKGLGLNRKVITIIEGESLVNDASALIAYRYAIAGISGTFVLWKAGLELLLVAGGGILAGLLVGAVMVLAHKKITNNTVVETSLSLLTPYIAYILAEHFHTSGVLSVVTAGLLISWRAREVFTSATRLHTKNLWDVVIFLLNGIIFILIGLQLPLIVKGLPTHPALSVLIGYGLIISLVTIIIRIFWVFGGTYYQNFLLRKGLKKQDEEEIEPVSWKNVMIVAWTGTRGVVSLATALALPLTLGNGNPFPQRYSILLLVFIVILVTLIVQGLTLPVLIRVLRIKPQNDEQKQDEKELELAIAERTLEYLDHHFPYQLDENVLTELRKPYEMSHSMLTKELSGKRSQKREYNAQARLISQMVSARLELLKFKRERLLQFHKEGTYSEESINKAERDLDMEDLRLQAMVEKGEDSNITFRQPQ